MTTAIAFVMTPIAVAVNRDRVHHNLVEQTHKFAGATGHWNQLAPSDYFDNSEGVLFSINCPNQSLRQLTLPITCRTWT